MQIVIDIPEEYYKAITEIPNHQCTADMLIIKNGTPLPKGHKRLIEITPQLEQELFTFTRYTGIDEYPYESAIIITDNAPTIIEVDKEDEDE